MCAGEKNKRQGKRKIYQEKCKELHRTKIILINGPKFAEIIATTTVKVRDVPGRIFLRKSFTTRELYFSTTILPWKLLPRAEIILNRFFLEKYHL